MIGHAFEWAMTSMRQERTQGKSRRTRSHKAAAETATVASDVAVAKRVVEPGVAQLRQLIEQASDGIFVADLEGRYTFVNEAGCRLLGFSREEIIGKTIFDFIPLEDVARLAETKELLLRGHTQVAEWRLGRKDGSWLPVEISAKILPDGQWQGFVRDISERKAHQSEREVLFQRILDERRWLQAVLDALPLGVVLYRLNSSAFYNQRAEELAGMRLSPDGGSAQYVNRVFYRDGTPVSPSQLLSSRVLNNEETIAAEEFLIRYPDGKTIPILGSAAPIRDADGRMIGGVCVFQDLTERMHAEEVIRQEQRLLKGIFEILPVGVWIADRAGRIVKNNPAGERIWAGSRDVSIPECKDYKGWWIESGKPIGADEWALARAMTKGETTNGELIRIQCFNGSLKTIIHSAAPMYDEDGNVVGGIVVNEDVTSLQHTQEQLRAAVRDRESILAMVTHDLRNPLAAIMLNADAAEVSARAIDGGEMVCEIAASLRENAQRMVGLVDDLLAVAVAEGGHSMLKLGVVDGRILFDKAVTAARPLFAERSLALEIDVIGELPTLNIDADRVLRVFANLIDNALKFTIRPGRILLAAETVTAGVRFTVANSGVAIPAQNLETMFQPFWQAAREDRRGAGLGLAICRSIV